jgi:hypothetical protein
MSNHRRRPALTGTGFFLISASVDLDHMTGRIATLTACFIRRCWHCGEAWCTASPLAEWQRAARDVRGQELPCGHRGIAEEARLKLAW